MSTEGEYKLSIYVAYAKIFALVGRSCCWFSSVFQVFNDWKSAQCRKTVSKVVVCSADLKASAEKHTINLLCHGLEDVMSANVMTMIA
jgi:hypothetical protein